MIKDEFEKRKGGKLSKKEEIKKEKERVKDEEDAIRTAKVNHILSKCPGLQKDI